MTTVLAAVDTRGNVHAYIEVGHVGAPGLRQWAARRGLTCERRPMALADVPAVSRAR